MSTIILTSRHFCAIDVCQASCSRAACKKSLTNTTFRVYHFNFARFVGRQRYYILFPVAAVRIVFLFILATYYNITKKCSLWLAMFAICIFPSQNSHCSISILDNFEIFFSLCGPLCDQRRKKVMKNNFEIFFLSRVRT